MWLQGLGVLGGPLRPTLERPLHQGALSFSLLRFLFSTTVHLHHPDSPNLTCPRGGYCPSAPHHALLFQPSFVGASGDYSAVVYMYRTDGQPVAPHAGQPRNSSAHTHIPTYMVGLYVVAAGLSGMRTDWLSMSEASSKHAHLGKQHV